LGESPVLLPGRKYSYPRFPPYVSYQFVGQARIRGDVETLHQPFSTAAPRDDICEIHCGWTQSEHRHAAPSDMVRRDDAIGACSLEFGFGLCVRSARLNKQVGA
jgi:hypothetical protein